MKNAEFSDEIKSMKSEQGALEADPVPAGNRLDYMHAIVESIRFNAISAALIVVNAAVIGVEIETGRIDVPIDERIGWYVVQNVLTIGFMIELAFRIFASRRSFFREVWNVVDLFLVILSMASTWVLSFQIPSASANLYVISSTLRIVRVITVGRLLRVLIVFKDLWVVIAGFVEAIKILFWVSIFLVFVLYIGAVFVTIEIGQNPDIYEPYKYMSGGWDYQEYFGSIGRSMLTLFQIVTLDDWSDGIARHVITNQPEMVIFFVLFVLVTSFGLMNVVVGIIVERTLAAAKQNQQQYLRNQERERSKVLNHLREIFEYADRDHNGSLTEEEFRSAIRQPEVQRKLKLIELPVADAEELFAILDHDGSGELSVEEFIGGCVRLKGPAKSKDLLAVQMNLVSLIERLDTIELQFGQIGERIRNVDSKLKLILEEAEVSLTPSFQS